MAQLTLVGEAYAAQIRGMKRVAAAALGIAAVGAAWFLFMPGSGPNLNPTGPAPSLGALDVRFEITFTFDNRMIEPDTWTAGSFTTTGALNRTVIAALGQARGAIGVTWPSHGDQLYGDWKCETPDQCLDKCTGGYDATWDDTPQLAYVERSTTRVVLDALLSADPKPNDDQFLTDDVCPPEVGGGRDGFPPMHITIDGLDGSSPTFAIEPYDFGGAEPDPGVVWDLTIKRLP